MIALGFLSRQQLHKYVRNQQIFVVDDLDDEVVIGFTPKGQREILKHNNIVTDEYQRMIVRVR